MIPADTPNPMFEETSNDPIKVSAVTHYIADMQDSFGMVRGNMTQHRLKCVIVTVDVAEHSESH